MDNCRVTLRKYASPDDSGESREIILQLRQFTKVNVCRAFGIPMNKSIYFEDRFARGTLYFFESDGSFVGPIGDGSVNYVELTVRISDGVSAAADNGESVAPAGTDSPNSLFSPTGVFSQRTAPSGPIPQRHHRQGFVQKVQSVQVTAQIGRWDNEFTKVEKSLATTFADVTESDCGLQTVLHKFVENSRGTIGPPLDPTVEYVLTGKFGVIAASAINFNYWKSCARYGTKITIVPKPPTTVPKTAEKRELQIEDTMQEAVKRFKQIRSLIAASRLEKNATEGGLTAETAKALIRDFTCTICLAIVVHPVVCVSCGSMVGCQGCLERALVSNRAMPCCRGTSTAAAGKKFIRVKGFTATLEKLRMWSDIDDSDGTTASTSGRCAK